MFRSTLMASALAALAAASYLGTIATANAAGYKETDLVIGCDPINEKPPKCDPAAKTLIDANGVVHSAQIFDRHLVNAWGLASTPTSQIWISDNGSGLSTTYVVQSNTPLLVSLGTPVVSIPSPGDPLGASGTPT